MMNALYYARGQTAWQEGVFRAGCFVICSGTADLLVRSIEGKRRVVCSFRAGDMIPCLNGIHRVVSNTDFAVQVESTSQLLVQYIPAESLGYLLVRYPSIVTKVIDRLSETVLELIHDLGVSSYCTVRARVARALESLDGDDALSSPLSQQQIAERVGASREAVNKVLHDMVDEKLISIEQRRIRVVNREKLQDSLL